MILLALLACAPSRDCGVALSWVEEGPTGSVSAIGDWNGWNPEADPLERGDDGVWRLVLDLAAGDYAYLLRVDGHDERDPFAPLLSWSAGEERSLLRVDDCGEPALRVDAATASSDGDLRVEATFLRSGARLADATATLLDGGPLVVDVSVATIVVTAEGLAAGKHTVLLTATDKDGGVATARIPLWVEERPFTWDDALIYQVMVDRFAGDGGAPLDPGPAIGARFGGTLDGVRARLDDIHELGANTVWLSPVLENAAGEWPGNDGHDYAGYHGYWPISADGIEPALGTAEDLDALVADAHARGMRVLLDVVPNHVHEDHPYRSEHAGDGWFHEDPGCICGDYSCPWSDAIETCWFTEYLPDLAWENPDVAAAIVADTVALVTAHDLDGVRVDAVPMLRRHAVRELVWGLSRALEQGPTDLYTLGETYTGGDGHADIRANLGPFGLDGQFDFPVLWALRDYTAGSSGDAEAFAATLAESEAAWAGSGAVMAPILGNHDTSRFISEATGEGGDDPWADPPAQPTEVRPYAQLAVAQAILLTLPGAPVVWQGDELGLAGANDPDSRRPMPAEDTLLDVQRDLRTTVATLGRTRACLDALRRGARTTLVAGGPAYAHLRDAGDGAPAVLVVNAADTDLAVNVTLPAATSLDASRFTDALGGPDVTFVAGVPTVMVLDPWTARLYIPAASGCPGAR